MATNKINESPPTNLLIHGTNTVNFSGSDLAFLNSGNAYTYTYLGNTSTAGSTAEYEIYLESGTYSMYCSVLTGNNGGVMSWYLDDVFKGVINCYSASTTYNVLKQLVSGVLITDPVTLSVKQGIHKLKFVCDSKDESSSAYKVGLYAIKFVKLSSTKTGMVTLNNLTRSLFLYSVEFFCNTTKIYVSSTGSWFYQIYSPEAAIGKYFSREICVSPGDYAIQAYFIKTGGSGTFSCTVDGVEVMTGDLYAEVASYNNLFSSDLVRLSGTHTIKFEITGKHASSSGYRMNLQYVAIKYVDTGLTAGIIARKTFLKNAFAHFPDCKPLHFATCSTTRTIPLSTNIGFFYNSSFTVFTSSDYIEESFYSSAGTFDIKFHYRQAATQVPYYKVDIDGVEIGTFAGAAGKFTTISSVTLTRGLHTLRISAPTANETYKYEGMICVFFKRS